jgi:hypothetical protein
METFGNILNILGVKSGNGNTSIIGHIDSKIISDSKDLFLI